MCDWIRIWTQIIVTIDDNLHGKLFQNWELIAEWTWTSEIEQSTNDLRIWKCQYYSNCTFSWQIDDVRIYNRVLSDDEIWNLYSINIAKHTNEKWSFTVSRTWLNDWKYTYRACAEDKSNLTWCTEYRDYYVNAFDIKNNKHLIDLASVRQEYLDQAQSITLYYEQDECQNASDLAEDILYAWKKKLKSLYYMKTPKAKELICESCSWRIILL